MTSSWELLWTYLELLAWSVYLGGALVMEFVWRPAQEHLPMSQIGVACQRMGRSYRWIALSMLGLIALTGSVRLGGRSRAASLSLSEPYGRTLAALVACWAVLVGLVALMAFLAHPALHVRTRAEMSDEERQAARAEVARSIKRMDLCLRSELVVALVASFLATTLRFGGL